MAITRGHSYSINDVVTAQSLNDLVRLASISGLDSSVLTSSSPQISTFSAPSGATYGWISAQYDPALISTNASFAHFNYVLTTPAGQVALFAPFGMETRRFSTNDVLPTGHAWFLRTVGSPGPTLNCGYTYTTGTPQHHYLGCNYGTAASGMPARLVFKGPIGGRVVDAGGAAVRHYWYFLNAGGGQHQHSAGVTNTNKVFGFSMDHRFSSIDTTMPGFLFGSPLWRA